MPGRGRSCSTCDHHCARPTELGAVMECRAWPPAVQAKPSAAATLHRDAMAEAAADVFDAAEVAYEDGDDVLGEAALNLSLAVQPIADDDLAVEAWPLVRPDDWCGLWRPEGP